MEADTSATETAMEADTSATETAMEADTSATETAMEADTSATETDTSATETATETDTSATETASSATEADTSAMETDSVQVEEGYCPVVFWRIQNVEFYHPRIHTKGIWTPWISIRSLGIERCCFYIKLDNRDHLSVTFFMMVTLDFAIDCEFSFLAFDDTPVITRTVKNYEIESPFGLMMPDCPTREQVFLARRNEYLFNNSISLRFRIWKSIGKSFSVPEIIWLGSKLQQFSDYFTWPIWSFRPRATQQKSNRITFRDSGREIQSFQVECWLISEDTLYNLCDCDVGFNVITNEVSETLLLRLKLSLNRNGQQELLLTNEDHVFIKSANPLPWSVWKCEFSPETREELSKFRFDQSVSLIFEFIGYYQRVIEVGKTHFGSPNIDHGNVNVFHPERSLIHCQVCQNLQQRHNIPHNLLNVGPSVVYDAAAKKPTNASSGILSDLLCVAASIDPATNGKQTDFPISHNLLNVRTSVVEDAAAKKPTLPSGISFNLLNVGTSAVDDPATKENGTDFPISYNLLDVGTSVVDDFAAKSPTNNSFGI